MEAAQEGHPQPTPEEVNMAGSRISKKQARELGLDPGPQRKPSKYRNKATWVDGVRFASKKEAARYQELKLLVGEAQGRIERGSLELQPRFPLKVNGQLICTYVADFGYREYDPVYGKVLVAVVEDVKSGFTRKNPVYRIKRKLMKALYGIDIREV
jgi:hypothetical protein